MVDYHINTPIRVFEGRSDTPPSSFLLIQHIMTCVRMPTPENDGTYEMAPTCPLNPLIIFYNRFYNLLLEPDIHLCCMHF